MEVGERRGGLIGGVVALRLRRAGRVEGLLEEGRQVPVLASLGTQDGASDLHEDVVAVVHALLALAFFTKVKVLAVSERNKQTRSVRKTEFLLT